MIRVFSFDSLASPMNHPISIFSVEKRGSYGLYLYLYYLSWYNIQIYVYIFVYLRYSSYNKLFSAKVSVRRARLRVLSFSLPLLSFSSHFCVPRG